jgi:hypothetical protein
MLDQNNTNTIEMLFHVSKCKKNSPQYSQEAINAHGKSITYRLDNSITTSDGNGCHSYADNAVKMKKNIVV